MKIGNLNIRDSVINGYSLFRESDEYEGIVLLLSGGISSFKVRVYREGVEFNPPDIIVSEAEYSILISKLDNLISYDV